MIDISLVGARLLTDERLPKDRQLVLEFAGNKKTRIRTAVHVRHSEPHKETGRFLSGLQLAPASFDERKAIAEFVSMVFQGQAGG